MAKALVDSPGDCLASWRATVCTAAWSKDTTKPLILSIIFCSVSRSSLLPWLNANLLRSADIQLHNSSNRYWPVTPVALV